MLRVKIVLLLLFGLSCAAVGAYAWHKTHDVQPITNVVIKEVEKPVYRYIKKVDPTDPEECRKLAEAPILISHKEEGSSVVVKATNGYTETEVKWSIEQKPDYTGEIIVGATAAIIAAYCTYRVSKGKPILFNLGSMKL